MNQKYTIHCRFDLCHSRKTCALMDVLRLYIGKEIVIQKEFGFFMFVFYEQLTTALHQINKSFYGHPINILVENTKEHGIRFIFRESSPQYQEIDIAELTLCPVTEES